MGQVMFYQLTRSALHETARNLLSRALAQGWNVMIRGVDLTRLQKLDERLWLGPEEDFLPHGIAGGPHDAAQPVLIGTGPIANSAKALMLVNGAEPLADELATLERTWVLFDGTVPAELDIARSQWKAVVAAGHSAQYWSEESGRWVKKSER
jgi:DNA polymerase-3 subunit chi